MSLKTMKAKANEKSLGEGRKKVKSDQLPQHPSSGAFQRLVLPCHLVPMILGSTKRM
jgi:hypothetical protein